MSCLKCNPLIRSLFASLFPCLPFPLSLASPPYFPSCEAFYRTINNFLLGMLCDSVDCQGILCDSSSCFFLIFNVVSQFIIVEIVFKKYIECKINMYLINTAILNQVWVRYFDTINWINCLMKMLHSNVVINMQWV